MDYKKFLHHKFMQSHGGVLDDDLPDTYDLWKESLTEVEKMKFIMEWEGLDTSSEEMKGKHLSL